jgi:hypothetical protein
MVAASEMCSQGAPNSESEATQIESEATQMFNMTCRPGSFVTGVGITVANMYSAATEEAGDKSRGSTGAEDPVIMSIGPIFCTRGMVVFNGTGPNSRILTSNFSQSNNPSVTVVTEPLGFDGMYMRTSGRVLTAVGPVPFTGRVRSSRPQDVRFVGGPEGGLKSVQCPGGDLVSGLHGWVSSAGAVSVGLYFSRIIGLD